VKDESLVRVILGSDLQQYINVDNQIFSFKSCHTSERNLRKEAWKEEDNVWRYDASNDDTRLAHKIRKAKCRGLASLHDYRNTFQTGQYAEGDV